MRVFLCITIVILLDHFKIPISGLVSFAFSASIFVAGLADSKDAFSRGKS